jgi:phenylalanyl-tRNA synthetase beta chain
LPAACAVARLRSLVPAVSGRTPTKGGGKPVDVFDAKADALAVIEACGLPMSNVQIESGWPAWYHPGRSGTIKMGPKIVLGISANSIRRRWKRFDVSGALCGFEIYVDAMPDPKKKATRTKPALDLSPFQVVKRDFAFVVDKTVEAGAIVQGRTERRPQADRRRHRLRRLRRRIARRRQEVDRHRSRLIQPTDKTLTDEDFDALTKKIVGNVEKTTGGALRA